MDALCRSWLPAASTPAGRIPGSLLELPEARTSSPPAPSSTSARLRATRFDGLLLTGVVDRLRPGAARALAHLAASRLAPGGVVVLVSARPEAAVAIDPVVADLAPGRPLHPVTWCHLLARYGLSELAVFEPDPSAPDSFAVFARRPVSPWPSAEDRR